MASIHAGYAQVIADLGSLLEEVCRRVPGGVVVFFPSYDYENKIHSAWAAAGTLAKLAVRCPLRGVAMDGGQHARHWRWIGPAGMETPLSGAPGDGRHGSSAADLQPKRERGKFYLPSSPGTLCRCRPVGRGIYVHVVCG